MQRSIYTSHGRRERREALNLITVSHLSHCDGCLLNANASSITNIPRQLNLFSSPFNDIFKGELLRRRLNWESRIRCCLSGSSATWVYCLPLGDRIQGPLCDAQLSCDAELLWALSVEAVGLPAPGEALITLTKPTTRIRNWARYRERKEPS